MKKNYSYSLTMLFFLTNVASANDFCQSYRDGDRSYENIISIAKLNPESDFDNDGISNFEEIQNGTHPCVSNTIADSDNDGLTDFYEENMSSVFITLNPEKRDSDDNGIDDLVQLCALEGEARSAMSIVGELLGENFPSVKDSLSLELLCGFKAEL